MFLTLLNIGAWVFIIVVALALGRWIISLPFWVIAKIVMETRWYKKREQKKRQAEALLYAEQYKHRYDY